VDLRLNRSQLTDIPSVLAKDEECRCCGEEETGPGESDPDRKCSDDRLCSQVYYPSVALLTGRKMYLPKGRTTETLRVAKKLFC